jgi:hypothetical protein
MCALALMSPHSRDRACSLLPLSGLFRLAGRALGQGVSEGVAGMPLGEGGQVSGDGGVLAEPRVGGVDSLGDHLGSWWGKRTVRNSITGSRGCSLSMPVLALRGWYVN